MAVIFLFAFFTVSALAAHSYFTKGSRLTFNFYFFAVLYASRWALRKRTFPTLHASAGYGINESVNSWTIGSWHSIFFSLSIILLCVALLYLCWVIVEKISERLSDSRISSGIIISALVAASFSYFIEIAGVGFGWWNLILIQDNLWGNFLFGCPYPVLISWFYFALYFFSAFFLIELSRLRKKSWKCIFILLAFIHSSVVEFFGPGMPATFERLIILAALILFAIYGKLSFDYSYRETKGNSNIIKNIPEILVCILIFSAFCAFTFVLNKPQMLFSLVPILLFFSFSISHKLVFIFAPVLLFGLLIDFWAILPSLFVAIVLFVFTYYNRKTVSFNK